MSANTKPIFALTPLTDVAVKLSAAMTSAKAFDGTEPVGTAMGLLGIAGAAGARVDELKINFGSTAGAAASGTTNRTVLRLWLNNGGVNTTAANNTLLANIVIPVQPYSNTEELPTLSLRLATGDKQGISIPAGYKLYGGLTTAVGGTNCALDVVALAGSY